MPIKYTAFEALDDKQCELCDLFIPSAWEDFKQFAQCNLKEKQIAETQTGQNCAKDHVFYIERIEREEQEFVAEEVFPFFGFKCEECVCVQPDADCNKVMHEKAVKETGRDCHEDDVIYKRKEN